MNTFYEYYIPRTVFKNDLQICYNLYKILLIEEVFYCYITLDNRMIDTKATPIYNLVRRIRRFYFYRI